MGLRDALKAKVKAALGMGAPAPPSKPSPPAPPPAAAPPSKPLPPAPAPTPASTPAPAADFRRVADSAAVRDDKPGTYVHAGINVAVFRKGGKLYALDNACAHEDGPIGEGAIDGCTVRCPYHDWQYDFTTGACITDPERQRATFAVKDADGGIWLGPQLTAGSESRGGEHDDGMEVIRK